MTCCLRCASETPPLTVFCPQCQQPNEPDFRLLINRIFDGRFQLYRELGEGGLSTVFAAIDLSNDNTVVVKVSDPHWIEVTGDFKPRGGIAITVVASHEKKARQKPRKRRPPRRVTI